MSDDLDFSSKPAGSPKPAAPAAPAAPIYVPAIAKAFFESAGKEEEAAALCELCGDMAVKIAALFRKHRRQLEKAYRETPPAEHGWDFAEVAQYVFASVQRGARELLEQDGTLASPKAHRNGVEWVFWAEEPKADAEA